MATAWRLFFGFGVLLSSLALGKWLRFRGLLSEKGSAGIVRVAARCLSPVVLCLSMWRMNLREVTPWLLPLIGFTMALSTLPPAWAMGRWLGLSRPQIGTFLTAAFFSNIGYLGGLLVFALFGETGYAFSQLYLVFFTPAFYTLGFWLAARYGSLEGKSARDAAADAQLRWYPFVGLIAGAGLSLAGIPRWAGFHMLNQVLIPLESALYLIVIGSQLKMVSPARFLKACLAQSAIKFVYTPIVGWLLLSVLGIHGLPRQVVLLLSATPVAVSPLLLPLLFGVDQRLMSALWWFTTALSVIWLAMWIPGILWL